MNEGLKAAQGEVVCFISADDIMVKGAAKFAIHYLLEHTHLDVVYGNYGCINQNGELIHPLRPFRKMPTRLYPLSLHISHSSVYSLRKSLLENQLFFDATFQYVGDYDWIVRILKVPLNIGRISKIFLLFDYTRTKQPKSISQQ